MAEPRSGSNALVSALNGHRDIYCHYEVYHPNAIHFPEDFKEALGENSSLCDLQHRNKNALGYLSSLVGHTRRATACLLVGLKLFANHSDTVRRHLIAHHRCQFLVLERENILGQFVSEEIANARQTYLYTDSTHGEQLRISVDFAKFEKFERDTADRYKRLYAELESASKACCRLTYSDIVNLRFEPALEFLGLEPCPLQPLTVKENSSLLRDKVSNYRELDKYLASRNMTEWLEGET